MYKFISFLFCLLISFTLLANTGKVKLSGNVENHVESSISITNFNQEQFFSTEIDENGNFEMSGKLQSGYYTLKFRANSADVFLYPNDELRITFNAVDFLNTIKFSGKGSERNNYLANKYIVQSEATKDLEAFYKVDESSFLENINQLKQLHLTSLEAYQVEPFFEAEERKALEFERLYKIQSFKTSYKFYIGEETTVSNSFYDPIQSLDLENTSYYDSFAYYHYLVNSVWMQRISNKENVEGMYQVFQKVNEQKLAISLMKKFYYKISTKEERAKDYLELIKKCTSHKPFIEACEKRYQEILASNELRKGVISPNFNYKDINDQQVSLEDLKGNYVYIDVWATWCAPCLKQIPYLQKLEEKFHNKNVVFVSISVDAIKSKASWRKMVKSKQLGGIQLFADNSFNSDFIKAYGITSIPRFIIIDPQGKIINPEAPRPSYSKTIDILNQLLE